MAMCKKAPTGLSPGEERRARWDRKDNRCQVAQTGTYRVSVVDPRDAAEDGPRYLGTSSAFVIASDSTGAGSPSSH